VFAEHPALPTRQRRLGMGALQKWVKNGAKIFQKCPKWIKMDGLMERWLVTVNCFFLPQKFDPFVITVTQPAILIGPFQ